MKKALSVIKQHLPSMTPVEKKIALCILEAPEVMVNETITHLAKRAGTSSGSVAKFAGSMGFSGFSDMKIRIAQSLGQSQGLAFDGVDAGDDPRAAMQKIISAAGSAFQDTFDAMGNELLHAVQLLMQARRIEVYASGSSLPIGQDVHYRLMRLGLNAVILPDPLIACVSASQLTNLDVVIAISHTGRTKNTLSPVETARRCGAKILVMTSFPASPLAAMSDVCLVSVSGEAVEYREAVVSRLTQLVITDSLCAYIAAQRGLRAMHYLDNEIEVLEKYRKNEWEE